MSGFTNGTLIRITNTHTQVEKERVLLLLLLIIYNLKLAHIFIFKIAQVFLLLAFLSAINPWVVIERSLLFLQCYIA